jgi:polyisoprenyl-phosphate glycosyltransferase
MDKALLPHLTDSGKNINIALFAYWLGFTPQIVSYDRVERKHGRSRWTFIKKLNYFLDSLLGFSVLPIRAISLVGMLVSVAAFAYGVVIIVTVLTGHREVQGFAALASLISFLLGLVIVMLGIIGEYVWRIFDNVNRRPESVIDETRL